jgi:cytochrome b6-f complex iron-sulfur subunit/menaquinol-cytochrome c reductase iron-sulfur subunit
MLLAMAEQEGRRRALKVLIGVGSAAFGGALAAPAAVFVAAPVSPGGAGRARWIRTVRLDSLEDSSPKKVAIVSDERDAWTLARDVELGAAWLVRRGDTVVAFSVTCPHLGCSINAEPDGKGFQCPCHTSAFGADGTRVSGPSPRDMDALATRIADGFVEIDFHKYRIGVAEKSEIA